MTRTELENYARAQYNKAAAGSIYEIYKNPSIYKTRSAASYENMMRNDNGYGMKYVKDNDMFYKCGYLYTDKSTGVIKLVWFIRSGNYIECDY